MSIFGAIMDKIFHPGHGLAAKPVSGPTQAGATQTAPAQVTPTQAAPTQAAATQAAATQTAPAPAAQAPAAPQPVDVEAVLSQLASEKGGGGHWRTSIVDLLKLLDLDSSLAARKQLANELGVHVAGDGSAEENIALHKAVMEKLAENGGKVPQSLRA